MTRYKQGRTFCFPWAASFMRSGRLQPRQRTQYWLAITKSSIRGIRHAGVVRLRGQQCVVIDYVPLHRKRGMLDPNGDSMCCFKGQVRIRVFEQTETAIGDTLADAARARRRVKRADPTHEITHKAT